MLEIALARTAHLPHPLTVALTARHVGVLHDSEPGRWADPLVVSALLANRSTRGAALAVLADRVGVRVGARVDEQLLAVAGRTPGGVWRGLYASEPGVRPAIAYAAAHAPADVAGTWTDVWADIVRDASVPVGVRLERARALCGHAAVWSGTLDVLVAFALEQPAAGVELLAHATDWPHHVLRAALHPKVGDPADLARAWDVDGADDVGLAQFGAQAAAVGAAVVAWPDASAAALRKVAASSLMPPTWRARALLAAFATSVASISEYRRPVTYLSRVPLDLAVRVQQCTAFVTWRDPLSIIEHPQVDTHTLGVALEEISSAEADPHVWAALGMHPAASADQRLQVVKHLRECAQIWSHVAAGVGALPARDAAGWALPVTWPAATPPPRSVLHTLSGAAGAGAQQVTSPSAAVTLLSLADGFTGSLRELWTTVAAVTA